MSFSIPETLRQSEWYFGPIPKEWRPIPLKHLCKQSALYGANISADAYTNDGVRFLRTSDIREDGRLEEGGVFLPADVVQDYILQEGDILISRSGTIGRAYVHRAEHGSCAYAGYLVRFILRDEQSPQFLFYVTKSPYFLEWLGTAAIEATIGNVNGEKYANMLVPVPPPSVQRAIAEYLDHETLRLDELITAKKHWWKVLEEKRRTLITDAVTRGLVANVPLRDSGIAWLGRIPSHWRVMRLKYACLAIRDGTHLPPQRTATGIPLLSVRNIVGEKFQTLSDDSLISEEDYLELCRSFAPQKNDVLLAIVGATLGKVAVIEEMPPFQIQRSLAVLSPKPELVDSMFLASCLRSDWFQQGLWQSVAFSAQPGIYLSVLNDFSIPVPPLPEQRAINTHIAAATSKVDALRSAAEHTIELLKERRAALIAAAVTGQLNISEAA